MPATPPAALPASRRSLVVHPTNASRGLLVSGLWYKRRAPKSMGASRHHTAQSWQRRRRRSAQRRRATRTAPLMRPRKRGRPAGRMPAAGRQNAGGTVGWLPCAARRGASAALVVVYKPISPAARGGRSKTHDASSDSRNAPQYTPKRPENSKGGDPAPSRDLTLSLASSPPFERRNTVQECKRGGCGRGCGRGSGAARRMCKVQRRRLAGAARPGQPCRPGQPRRP